MVIITGSGGLIKRYVGYADGLEVIQSSKYKWECPQIWDFCGVLRMMLSQALLWYTPSEVASECTEGFEKGLIGVIAVEPELGVEGK